MGVCAYVPYEILINDCRNILQGGLEGLLGCGALGRGHFALVTITARKPDRASARGNACL